MPGDCVHTRLDSLCQHILTQKTTRCGKYSKFTLLLLLTGDVTINKKKILFVVKL